MLQPHLPYVGAAVLGVVEMAGLDSMFGRAYRSGWIAAVGDIIGSSDPQVAVLPLSSTKVLKHYTGWSAMDNLLAWAAVMWANVVDGSTPPLSLYAIQFSGQLVPVFAVFMIEGLRIGNSHNAFYYSVLWGYLMQMFGYATIMPLYCSVHLLLSPTAGTHRESARPRYLTPLDLRAVAPAISLGYGGLTFLFAYPFASGDIRQWLCAVWQGFPLHVVGIQYILANTILPKTKSKQHLSRTLNQDVTALSSFYNFCFYVAASTQIFVFSVLGVVAVSPTLFPAYLAETLTVANVFVPGPWYSFRPMESMATEMHTMLLYDQYVGSMAGIIWAVILYSISRSSPLRFREQLFLGFDVLKWCVIGGPAGAVVRLLQRRDTQLLLQSNAPQKKAE
ncbi:hypothetical protein GQ53DRAFT_836763 [Thozetella sp. PMI_491]|nr:hypothetical protein GQ53DRAFT_836763 [Thozetella sp. PMI_491]